VASRVRAPPPARESVASSRTNVTAPEIIASKREIIATGAAMGGCMLDSSWNQRRVDWVQHRGDGWQYKGDRTRRVIDLVASAHRHWSPSITHRHHQRVDSTPSRIAPVLGESRLVRARGSPPPSRESLVHLRRSSSPARGSSPPKARPRPPKTAGSDTLNSSIATLPAIARRSGQAIRAVAQAPCSIASPGSYRPATNCRNTYGKMPPCR
jgi:hypothetical protein